MKKVLFFVLAVVMVMSLTVPAAAAPEDAAATGLISPGATAADLKPELTEESHPIVEIHTTEEVLELHEDVQEVMAEAKEQLADACPQDFAVKYFFYVEIVNAQEKAVTVSFESIVKNVAAEDSDTETAESESNGTVDVEDIKQGRIVFMQFVDGKWVELEFEVNEDGTITVFNVVEGPVAIFVK